MPNNSTILSSKYIQFLTCSLGSILLSSSLSKTCLNARLEKKKENVFAYIKTTLTEFIASHFSVKKTSYLKCYSPLHENISLINKATDTINIMVIKNFHCARIAMLIFVH